jgi:hypothetical protein
MQFNGDVDGFVRWCASTRSVGQFVAALRSVPEEHWAAIVTRLNVALDHNRHRGGRKLEAFGEVCVERIPF